MNVKECSIYLADNKKKFLRHIVTVSNKKQSRKKKRIRIGEGLVGKVAKSAVPILENNSLAIPLIEEDVLGVIVVHEKKNQKPLGYLDQDILTTLAEQAVVAIKNSTLHKQQEKLTLGSIKSLTALSGSRSVHTHISKLKYRNLVLAIAKELNLSKRKMQALKYASLLHDVGKIGIPEEILKKVGTLTSEEYNIVKEHPKRAASILKPLKVLEPAMPIILHHHEKYDGTGYPDGLKGKQIPMGARILSLVDAFEAMITKRSYRRCKSLKTALKEIKRNSGSQFDPKVVGAFLKIINKKKFNKEKLLK
jgi:HD-GYP domain-containing protein (c-di-GMP phosphodiesterase class II)